MQTTTIVFKTESPNEFKLPAGAIVSSTSSPPANSMRPPPPPPPRIKCHETKLEEPSSSMPDLEFDGTTVLCRVCGDKASGFHYGVHSCEGCKGFFRRSIQQKIQYRPCTKNQQCSILRINRNRCQYCRLKKCIAVGMSRDAVRFGRVPKREKARILAAMQQSSNTRSLEKLVAAELEDDIRIRAIIVQAHLDTCDFTKDKIEPMLAQAREQAVYASYPSTSACALNPCPYPAPNQQEAFSKTFSPAIRGVVEYAKQIPGFRHLHHDDQVTLLKAGVFEVLLVRLACMFDSQTSTMVCLNGNVMRRDAIQNSSNARFLTDSMFDFADRIQSLNLAESEIALFTAVVLITADRPGLRNVEVIEKLNHKLKTCLLQVVRQNHPDQPQIMDELMKKIPDLRTLNTLHCEKLLNHKFGEQEQQQHLWNPHSPRDDDNSRSPPSTISWVQSPTSDIVMDDDKSPLGSVSSSECASSPEMLNHNDYVHHHIPNGHGLSSNVTNAPLLQATLTAGLPHRQRTDSISTSSCGSSSSGSSGDDDLAATSHLINNGLTITPVSRPPSCYAKFRKVDSPTDSGIESGPEKFASECSSPRSTVDDHHPVEDMPVLKRVLQAPPLYDTNSLMDEAYKPHKKFRALRNKDSAEAEPVIVMSPPLVQSPLQRQLNSPPQSSLSSTHSTLAKSLMEGPRMTAEQMKRTDIIHKFIMRGETPVVSPMATQTPTSCPYKSNGSLLQPAWATASVITTTARQPHIQFHHNQHQQSNSYTPPPQQEYPQNRMYFLPQSPHSTSPTPSRSPGSPHSTLLTPKMMELQVDIADSQQPLNLSKKSPSPPPRSNKMIKLEV